MKKKRQKTKTTEWTEYRKRKSEFLNDIAYNRQMIMAVGDR